MNPVRICSWNINGLRSIQHPLKTTLDSLKSDIICIQETKTTRMFMLLVDALKFKLT